MNNGKTAFIAQRLELNQRLITLNSFNPYAVLVRSQLAHLPREFLSHDQERLIVVQPARGLEHPELRSQILL